MPSDDCLSYGVQVNNDFKILPSADTIEWILSLPRGTWLLTFESSWLSPLLGDRLELIQRAEIFGEFQCTDIEIGNTKVFVIDLRQITRKTFKTTARKLGESIATMEQGLELHLLSKVGLLATIWYKYIEALSSAWEIFPSKTTGATALKAWRGTLPKGTKLKSRGCLCNRFTRESIRPGAFHYREGYYPQAYEYDINGSYIHAMRTVGLPLNFNYFINRTPSKNDRWIARVRIKHYHSNLQWGVLPIQSAGGVWYRPVIIEDYVTTITYIDYLTMQLTGVIEIEFQEGILWHKNDDVYLFNPWIDGLEQASQNPQGAFLLKAVSRSLYAKFAQNTDGTSLILQKPKSKQEVIDYIKQGLCQDLILTPNGGTIMQLKVPYKSSFVPFQFPHFYALILAAGRLQLYSNIDQNTIYADTDEIFSITPRLDLPISEQFGAWKEVNRGRAAISGMKEYFIGDKVSYSGIANPDMQSIKNAIYEATRGSQVEVTAFEVGNLVKNTKSSKRTYTVTLHKYPYVELKGCSLFVTASPTVEYPAIRQERLFSLDTNTQILYNQFRLREPIE